MVQPPNLHIVWSSDLPLLVRCTRCQHRAALPHDKIDAHQGNMKRVSDIKLVCTKCGSRDVETRVVYRDADVKKFFDEYRR